MVYPTKPENNKFSRINKFTKEYEEAERQVSTLNEKEDKKSWLFAKNKARSAAQFYRLRLIGLLFIYFVAANLTFVDKFEFVNDWDLNIDLNYWESNAIFLSSVVFWFNLFLLSLLPIIVAKLLIKDRIFTYCTYTLPLYWGYLFFLGVTSERTHTAVLVPNMRFFIYGLLIIAMAIVCIRLVFIFISLQLTENIDEVQRFKEEAIERLVTYNPYVNRKMVDEYLGEQGEAFNLMLAAHLEKNDRKKELLTRLALLEMANVKERQATAAYKNMMR